MRPGKANQEIEVAGSTDEQLLFFIFSDELTLTDATQRKLDALHV
jgi:hypothetical protein